jgi:hypothetical protein
MRVRMPDQVTIGVDYSELNLVTLGAAANYPLRQTVDFTECLRNRSMLADSSTLCATSRAQGSTTRKGIFMHHAVEREKY